MTFAQIVAPIFSLEDLTPVAKSQSQAADFALCIMGTDFNFLASY